MDRFERAGQTFAALCRTMAKLRGPGGCPWDRKQTFETLKGSLIEETYEVLDSMGGEKHAEELGDLLLQIVFQAEIAAGEGTFDATTVAQSIQDKLVRRHPHIFGDEDDASNAETVAKRWEDIKDEERQGSGSRLDGIPRSMPALLRATATGRKAASLNFDWPNIEGVLAKVHEEVNELLEVLPDDEALQQQRRHEELGDLLFAMANLARWLGIDPEAALADATDKFTRRFKTIESDLRALQQSTSDAPPSLADLEALWNRAKAGEGAVPTQEPSNAGVRQQDSLG